MNWAILGLSIIPLALAGAIRAAGASLVRTNRADALHDAAEGNANAQRIADLLEDRPRLQPALGMVHSTLLVITAVAAAWAISGLASGWALLPALVGLGIVLALFGDFLPREWGRGRPRTLAYRFPGLLEWAVNMGGRAADLIADEEDDEESEPDDATEIEERELISSVLEFTDAIVREVMVPRPDMIVVRGDASTDEALDVVLEEGRSRVPVQGSDIDHIIGILYARDLLGLMDRSEPAKPVRELMRPPYFVPETKRVSELLREMQGKQVHMAIVVDEFGGTAGLCTIEDLIEELVGEIADEYDVEEPLVTALPGGGYRVDGRLAIDDLAELFDVEFPDEEWDTVGGLVLGLAGRVPDEGESFELDGLEIVADRVQGRRVSEVTISRR